IRKLHNHGHYTMVVIVTSSGLDTCGSVGDEPIVASRRICPVIESRSGRCRDQKRGWGFGLPSLCTRDAQTCLCNQVAQTWASVPYSTQEPMLTMTGALVAVRHGKGRIQIEHVRRLLPQGC